jgi:hypothetical protein
MWPLDSSNLKNNALEGSFDYTSNSDPKSVKNYSNICILLELFFNAG